MKFFKRLSIIPNVLLLILFITLSSCTKELDVVDSSDIVEYLNNEDGTLQDFLTPQYYNSADGNDFRTVINKFIYYARLEQFHNPLKNDQGNIPEYIVTSMGEFGAKKGANGIYQHHPAVDLHVGNSETFVNLYAAYDGFVSTYRDADKYRSYISITKNIVDDNGNVIGKLVTIYAHVDLDLDEAENLFFNDKNVLKGELISKNLYSLTAGGPHLHFEIRYYRAYDLGNETFYGSIFPGQSTQFTEKSAGIWEYGYWNTSIGYGFGNPNNHGLNFY